MTTTRRKLDPATKAADALAVADRKLAAADARVEKLTAELNTAREYRNDLHRERNYLAANPYLTREGTDAGGMTTSEAAEATALPVPGPA